MNTPKRVFKVDAEIRDENNKIVESPKGSKITRLQFDFEVDDNKSTYQQLQKRMTSFCEDLQVFLPKHKINLGAFVYNGISGTWMEMAGYYGEEKRFVIFS